MRHAWVRIVGALIAVSAVVGLTAGCEPRTGAAAFVDGTRISESDIDGYVFSAAKPFVSNNVTVDPRSYAVRQVVLGYAYARLLAVQGGPPTAAELNTAQDAVIGTSTDAELVKIVVGRGFKPAFEPVLVRTQSLLGVLNTRLKGSSEAQVRALLTKADLNVKINPQYGTWDPDDFSVTNGPAVGDFLRTSSTPSAAAAS